MKKKLVPKKIFINPVYKDKATVLKTEADTNGAYSLGHLEVSPGGGNSMHTHIAFEETFTAITGVLGVAVGETRQYLYPGQSVTIPLHTPHHFFNDGNETVTCQVKFVPGHDNFIKGLAIGYGLARDGKTTKKGIPKNIHHLALLITLTDTKPTGILGWLFPVFKQLAARARKNGLEQQLLEQYYYE